MTTYTGNPAADMAAWLADHPAPATRSLSADEQAAVDWRESVGEARREEALLPMSRSDEDRRQAAYDEWLTGGAA